MKRKSMLLIYNPVAGSGDFAQNLSGVIERFAAGGFEVTIYPSAGQRDAYRIARDRAASFDYLVCSGGDGTLNEVVDALMPLEKKPLLGYVPSGTTNDFAFTHGLEPDVFLAADAILEGRPIGIDVGRFRDEYFTYVAAFGLFTDVSYGTPQGLKNMLGHAAYILEGMKKLGSVRDIHCTVECDGEIIEGDFILGMVANSHSIAGFHLPAGTDIQLDDGLFELILLRRVHSFAELQEVARVLAGTGSPGSSFIVRSVRRVKFTCAEPLDWSIDGEYGGAHTQAHIEVCKQALELITREKNPES